jgi:hypothetical protein
LPDRKYHSALGYLAARARRVPLRLALADLVRWEPQRDPEPGYTIAIAAMRDLAEVCLANLELVGRMNLGSARALLVVMDCTADELPDGFVERASDLVPQVPVRVLTYDRPQHRVSHFIDWGWVYSWLSWCKAIAAAPSRYVLLHDLDAMPLDPDLFERQYRAIEASDAAFLGVKWYTSSGFKPDDRLATTFEMILDAAFVRSHFTPIDAFNDHGIARPMQGVPPRYMDYDTFLMMQQRAARTDVAPIPDDAMVHPSQLICQYTDLLSGRARRPHPRCNLPILPYYLHLGGNPDPLRLIIESLSNAEQRGSVQPRLPFGEATIDLSAVSPGHGEYIRTQIARLERALYGRLRPEIAEYLRLLERAVPAAADPRPAELAPT